MARTNTQFLKKNPSLYFCFYFCFWCLQKRWSEIILPGDHVKHALLTCIPCLCCREEPSHSIVAIGILELPHSEQFIFGEMFTLCILGHWEYSGFPKMYLEIFKLSILDKGAPNFEVPNTLSSYYSLTPYFSISFLCLLRIIFYVLCLLSFPSFFSHFSHSRNGLAAPCSSALLGYTVMHSTNLFAYYSVI